MRMANSGARRSVCMSLVGSGKSTGLAVFMCYKQYVDGPDAGYWV